MIVTYRPIDWIDWLPKDLYRVGDDGSVWRFYKGFPRRPKRWPSRWKRLEGKKASASGCTVALAHLGQVQHVSVARLVLRAFVGPSPIGCCPYRFPDGDLANDRLDNLRWMPNGTWLVGKALPEKTKERLVQANLERNKATRKLSDSDVASVFRMFREGWMMIAIADEFDVDFSIVQRIIAGKNYTDVECDRTLPVRDGRPERQGVRSSQSKLTDSEVHEIRDKHREGSGFYLIAKEYGVSPSTVRNIVRGKDWRHVPGADTDNRVHPARKGSQHGIAKLNESDIPEIRTKYRSGLTHAEIAQEYGVSRATIGNIVNGKVWSHIPDQGGSPAKNRRARGSHAAAAKLCESDIPAIKEKYRSGMTFAEIARDYGVAYQTVGQIIKGKTWTHVA